MKRTLLPAVFAAALAAQTETRLAVSAANETAYAAGARAGVPEWSNVTLIQPSLTWRSGQRWRAAVSAAGILAERDETHARVLVKEAYAGFTSGDLDFTLGKKILRWGTGYAFTPTGVLDPPRSPTDPTDRLNLNEGREMAAADWIRGRHAVTVAWASGGLLARHRPGMRETTAVRYNTLVAGFDSSLIVARDRAGRTFTGANFTRVLGESIELHGEFARRRALAALLGGKLTTRRGVNFIFEFYSAAEPRRRRYGFVYVGKSRLRELPGWKEWDLGFSLVRSFDDSSSVGVCDVTRRIRDRVSLYARAETPHGAKWRTEYGMIPYAALVSFGLRYQI